MKILHTTILSLCIFTLASVSTLFASNKLDSSGALAIADTVVFQKNDTLVDFTVKPIRKKQKYDTNKTNTIAVEIINNGKAINEISLFPLLPHGWKVFSTSDIKSFKENEKKIVLISFYIPYNASPKENELSFRLLHKGVTVKSIYLSVFVLANTDLQVINVQSPQNIQAGEIINTTYTIKNTGNITQKIELKSNNEIKGSTSYKILPSMTVQVNISQKTDSNISTLRNGKTSLEVMSLTSGKKYKKYSATTILPNKIKKKDPFFRFPVQMSLLYNSYTSKTEHYSTVSAEIRGDGYLDNERNHTLNFIFRGPRNEQIKRFGVTDQYSLRYRYKDLTTVNLGDQNNFIDRLGFSNRYGIGARIDQRLNNWDVSAFYLKPRLYSFNSKALYGAKTTYHVTDSISGGISLARSKSDQQRYGNNNIANNTDEEGQIITFSFNYNKKETTIAAESSTSMTNRNVDYANYIRINQNFRNWHYSGNYTIAGKQYFGTLNNSIQYTNNLNYRLKKWNFSIGQSLYKVNKRLNPLFYAAEPFFKSIYAKISYRYNNKHQINLRFDQRQREDRLEPKNYHYNEYGLNYRYTYNSRKFTANFNGRFGKTQNLLTQTESFSNTYSHSLGLSYRFVNNLTLRTNVNHNYTNRYGRSTKNVNYITYSLGFNYKINKQIYINTNYNSGFSPEETFAKRDYINANLSAIFNKNHQFQLRANYYQSPGITNRKETLIYGRYTYTSNVPLKKMVKQGGVNGHIITNDNTIDKKGIRIIASGKTLVSDNSGKFEFNNLDLGKNYILIDQSSLPQNVVASAKMPLEVKVHENKRVFLDIQLVKSANVFGSIKSQNTDTNKFNLSGYVKLYNNSFVYYTETDPMGNFKFQQIVPGNYALVILEFKEKNKLFQIEKAKKISINEGETVNANFNLKVKKQFVKFKTKNFKIGK
ncbi:hypothetical protein [uncultured Flavobacterium sp.]|uniref:hypothetical protein n=1 Tax=uncultured Flavobacterium sp. TaxID=165435 RepID=UPI0030EBAC04|tara:strand:+ start:4900 stop:7692 length:2793 start_codon:yes stop_codon:yes gene_type:complete